MKKNSVIAFLLFLIFFASGCSSNSHIQEKNSTTTVVGVEGLKLIDSEEKMIGIIENDPRYKDWVKIMQVIENPGDSRGSILKTLEFLKDMGQKYHWSSIVKSCESDIKELNGDRWKNLPTKE